MCNTYFFLNYGFVEIDNRDDEATISIELNQSHQFFAHKMKLLETITSI